MSTAEIIEKLPELPLEELEAVRAKASQLLDDRDIDETPAVLAAIDEGIASWEREGGVPIEELQEKFGAQCR